MYDKGTECWKEALRKAVWKVKVPNRFREHMKRPEAFQVGWSRRRFFPARVRVPDLNLAPGGAREEAVAANPEVTQ